MQTKQFTRLSGMVLAVMLTLLIGSVRAHDSKLEGTWDVILKFPQETCDRTECNCPRGMPNIPIRTLNTFLKGGGMVWSTTTYLVGPGQGAWGHLGHNDFMAHFRFYIFFDPNDTRYEEVTQFITLTDPDTYTGTMTYDLLHAADDTPIAQGCSVNK